MNNQDFISRIIQGALEGYSQYGILPSITLAQAILESSTGNGPGTSYSANYDLNLFGIKMDGAKPSGMMIVQGSAASDGGYYRRYQSWDDSVVDHGFFLANNSRYANVIGNTDYVSVANNLQADGYAQSNTYASSLINLIETYNLTQYDIGSYSGRPVDTFGPVVNFPATNYEVVPGSTQTGDTLYGRRYRVIVSDMSGNTALDVSDLHITFNCVKIVQMQPQYSHVVIYNLSPKTENVIIQEGDRVVIEAGYEGSQYGLIFDGNVIQAIRDKPDGATYTLTLVCADSDTFLSYSLSAFSMVKGQNSRTVAQNLINKASIPTAEGFLSPNLSESTLTRGKVVFGMTRDYLRQIAKSQNATYYMEDGKVNIIKADDVPQGEIIDLSPSSGLVGVPAQSDYGVTIRSLMNPRIKLNSLIHVDNSLIRNQEYNQGQALYSLDNDGIYRVIKVTYIGDTRGQDFYTEVEAITQSGILPALIANGNQSAW